MLNNTHRTTKNPANQKPDLRYAWA